MSRQPTVILPQERESAHEILIENYHILDNLYRNGFFESRLFVQPDGRLNIVDKECSDLNKILVSPNNYRVKIGNSTLHLCEAVGLSEKDLNKKVPSLLVAALLLLLQTIEFEKKFLTFFAKSNASRRFSQPDDLEKVSIDPFRLTIRSYILCYEISDYSLCTPKKLLDWLEKLAKDILPNAEKAEINIDEYISNNYWESVLNPLRKQLNKDVILAMLCYVNHLYRQHNIDSYELAFLFLDRIEKYLMETLPQQTQENQKSFALIGLFYYLKGRVSFAKSHYAESELYFKKSTELYMDKLLRSDPTDLDFEESSRLTMRRVALTSVLGSGFQALVESRVSDALRICMISRSILHNKSGRIYQTYANLIFQSSRRAFNSADKETILDVISEITKCREIFLKLVPQSHYMHRAGIELSLALHYLAKIADQEDSLSTKNLLIRHADQQVEIFPDELIQINGIKINKSNPAETIYEIALSYLNSAIKFTEKRNNTRLRCEALTIFSHLARLKVKPNLSQALKRAQEAVELSKGINQIESEALIAHGAVLVAQGKKAAETASKPSLSRNLKDKARNEMNKNYDLACTCFENALQVNHGTNSRIAGVAFLQLAQCYIENNRIPLAKYFYRQWQRIESRIEHKYVGQKAREIQRLLNNPEQNFTVDLNESENLRYWQDKMENWFILQDLIKFAEKIIKNPNEILKETNITGTEFVRKIRENDLYGINKLLIGIIKNLCHIKDSKAYELIKKYNLIEDLRKLLVQIKFD